VDTLRAEEVTQGLRDLIDAIDCDVVHVERLEPDDVQQLIAQMLGQPVQDDMAAQVAHRANGNPFFVAEYLQTIIDSGALDLNEAGQWELQSQALELREPESLQTLIGGRLTRLPAPALQTCEAASLLGRRFPVQLLRAVVYGMPIPFSKALDLLVQRQILEFETPDRVQFVHDKLREAAYASVSEEARSAMHRDVARILAARRAPPGVLGAHWESGQRPERARAAYIEGARRALGQYALGDAEGLFVDAIELTEDDGDAHALQLELAQGVWLPRGRAHDAVSTVGRVVREAGRRRDQDAHPELRARALQVLGDARLATGDVRGAERSLKEASTRYAHLAMSGGQADVWMTLGRMHQRDGAWDEARDAFDRALAIYRRLQDRSREAQAMGRMGEVAISQGKWREARSVFEQSRQIHQRLGEPLGAALSATCIGAVALAQGKLDEARELADQVREEVRDLGDRRVMARAERLAMRVALEDHRLEDAERARRRAIELFAQARDARGVASVWLASGEGFAKLGDLACAAQAYSEVLSLDGAHLTGELASRLEALRARLRLSD